ncbi:RND family efflux transporter MFP subunit [Rhodopseudomonas julia]|uniref:RND family efflux transporter MFP subunit n=1 Tax=Rhodopseudomonas julia TaxID=200617 RepID=A0ABU0C1A9_9BRAD|nr:efflux RND transporter periplasmic adaptor subunit [Rhodopseudomonas julia]MDQ0324296.1 RND family efflux transporter MFP subunit [Rhodopseudomonas julia]
MLNVARQSSAAAKAFAAILLALVALPVGASPAASAEMTVTPRVVPETKAVFGQVKSRDVVAARARIGGTIEKISVDEGSEVEKGEMIAVIIDDKIPIQKRAADAKIEVLRSQLANANTDLERAQQLRTTGAVSQSRLDEASTQVQVYTNQLAAAEAERAVIEQNAREGEVLAPASGRVIDVPVTPGSVVMAGDQIATVAGGGYFLRLSLPERHAAEIVEGDMVKVGDRVLSADGIAREVEPRTGRLVKVYPEIEDGKVKADVEVEGLGDYFVGERTLVWIPVATREVLAVPRRAVTTRHGIDYVTLQTEEGPVEVAVVLGRSFASQAKDEAANTSASDANAETVEILSGLEAGDRVVLP